MYWHVLRVRRIPTYRVYRLCMGGGGGGGGGGGVMYKICMYKICMYKNNALIHSPRHVDVNWSSYDCLLMLRFPLVVC